MQVSTKLNRSHIVHGKRALILPCLGRTEKDAQASGVQGITVEDAMSMVHISYGMKEPGSPQLRSECAILAGMAQATLPDSRTPWQDYADDYDRIRDTMAQVLDGFEDFNTRARQPHGFRIAQPARERVFQTPSGRAEFSRAPLPDDVDPGEGRLLLATVRSHDQFNTTIYSNDDRYRGLKGLRTVVFMNEDDMRDRGLEQFDLVDVTSFSKDGTKRTVHGYRAVRYEIPPGCAAGYMPELNVLCGIADVSTPERAAADEAPRRRGDAHGIRTEWERMTSYGYSLMCELHGPNELLAQAVARRGGWVRLHHDLRSLPSLALLAPPQSLRLERARRARGADDRVELVSLVTCPTIRYHPAIVAQKAATVATMSGGRFRLGVGAGENLNEHVVGRGWPPAHIRHEMLEEAIEIMRALWAGGYHPHEGKHYTVHDARIFTLPAEPPPVYVAASGAASIALAARAGDGMIATEPRARADGSIRRGCGRGQAEVRPARGLRRRRRGAREAPRA